MIRYQYQTDEFVAPSTPVFDEDSWWYSVQKCGALIAFAAAMVLTQSQTAAAIQVSQQHPEEIASKFYFDEDTWQNPVAPQLQQNFTRQPFVTTDEIPLGRVLDDSAWWNPAARHNPTIFAPQPFNISDEFVNLAVSAIYEDTWQNPAALFNPTVFTPQPFTDLSEFLSPILSEDSWQNPTQFAASSYAPQPFNYSDDFVAPFALYEDTWQNAVPSVLAKNILPPSWDAFEGVQAVIPPAPTGAHYIPTFRRRRR